MTSFRKTAESVSEASDIFADVGVHLTAEEIRDYEERFIDNCEEFTISRTAADGTVYNVELIDMD